MATYSRILLPVDLTPASWLVGQRARELASALGAQLQLLHVAEPIAPVVPMPPDAVGPSMVTTQAGQIELAQEQLTKLGLELGVAEENRSVVVGSIKSEIVRMAAEGGIDLIVIGSRERHGLALLIRPTEDAIVHRAPCDVLVVRLGDENSARE
jgi:universal stress protein A